LRLKVWQDKLKEIIYLLENSEVNEIEASFWGRKYRVVKKPTVVAGGSLSSDTVTGAVLASDTISKDSTPQKIASEPEKQSEQILSPMPGTFYSASSPETPKYVNVGDKISKGDTLCIVEAMKIMNEIEAEKDGIIKTILVENGQPVEYNQPLFELE